MIYIVDKLECRACRVHGAPYKLPQGNTTRRQDIALQRITLTYRHPCLQTLPMQEVVGALMSIGLAVRSLSMASNDIGDAGARAIGRLLEDKPPGYRCALASLNLRGNTIGSEGCQVWSEGCTR